ncbi:MAG: hypothetical protein CMN30_15105 [Sandaracinus sp.]|nr:hypothetical protein [Sandaracinus sp.]
MLLSVTAPWASCADPASFDVRVDVRTDYRPGRDFVGTKTTIVPMAGDAGTDVEAEERLGTEGDFLAGERIANFSGLGPGIHLVSVSLIGSGGEVVSSRRVSADVRGSSTVTVVITQSCRDQVCPAEGDDDSLTECAGGRCVDPRCSPEAPELCGDRCESDGECPAASACTRGVCTDGTCLVAPDDDSCGAARICDLEDGCVSIDGSCAPRESLCDDGVDEDCDGVTDCADPDCAGASCDDGVFCNGPDHCEAGRCAAHEGSSCERLCDEGGRRCVDCNDDGNCGAPVEGAWGPCEAAIDDCSGQGVRRREVRVPTCVDGGCTEVTTTQTEACPVPRPEGSACGGDGRVCCGGACSRLDSNDHCGACRVSCASIGTTCAPTGTGGFGCVGCTTDAACRSILNGAATCYGASGPAWCRCQCPIDGTICDDGGCGPGFRCNDDTGFGPHYCF